MLVLLTDRRWPPDPDSVGFFGATGLVLVGSLAFVGPWVTQKALREDVAVLALRAVRMVDEGRFSEALEVMDRCVAIDASQPKVLGMRASIRGRLGDHVGAIEDASRAIAIDPEDFGAHYQRGLSLHQQGERARALADYDRALALEPGNAMLHGVRGDCLREMDALGAAVAAYDAAIELNPNWVGAYAGRAKALNALTDFAAARSDLGRATELAPEVAEFWWLRAFAEVRCGDDAAALRSSDEFVRLQPDELRTWATKCQGFLVWDAGDFTLAAELFSRAAQDESGNAELLRYLGHVQLVSGNFDAATAAFEGAARHGDPRQLGRARMMQWCIDARTLGLDEAGEKLAQRIGERIQEFSAFERDLVGFCRTGDDSTFVAEALFPSEVCAWSFVAAWRRDLAGDDADAERWLRRCLNTGSVDSAEWKSALLFLRSRLDGELRPVLGAELELIVDPAGPRGVVRSITAGSAAECQGLRVGDELLDLRGRAITREAWDSLESRGRIGLPLRVTRRRAGELEVLRIHLGVAPGV